MNDTTQQWNETHGGLGAQGAVGDPKPQMLNQGLGAQGAAGDPKPQMLNQVPNVKIFLDGQALGPGAIGAAIPVDPGKHLVRAIALDKPTFEKVLDVGKGPLTLAVEVVFPGDKPTLARWTPLQTVGIGMATTGVLGLFIGGGFGIGAIVKNNASKEMCLPENAASCSEQGVMLRNQAGTFADVSTGTLLAGGVLVGVGMGLFFLAGPTSKEKPRPREMRFVPVVEPGFGGAFGRMEF
jgi:hypothetical protein